MIEIKYLNNNSGKPALFELLFPLSDYIPKNYFQKYGENAEISFYIDLLKNNGIFSGKKENFYLSPTFDCIFRCNYNGIEFDLLYDDWGTVCFSVEEKHILRREELAQHIKMLIKQQKPIAFKR